MKLNKKLNSHMFIFIYGCFVGAFVFSIVYGLGVVNPTYDDWICIRGGDCAQHYLGWKFYRLSDWHFPIGLFDGLTGDDQISIMFTDSIPLFAIFFKILSPILPHTFQYIGLWALFCFTTMGGVSALLLRRFSKSIAFCLVGCVFFVISPPIIHRTFGHDGLSGQWVIITALLLWAYHDHKWKHSFTPVILWAVLGALSVLVHMYFLPMIYIIMIGYILTDIFKNKRIVHSIACFVSTTCTAFLTMFVIGAFHGNGSVGAAGLGLYSANYNALFNSIGFSKFLKELNYRRGQTEGLGYLGLGAIVAGVLALVLLFFYTEKTISTREDWKKVLSSKYKIILPIFVVVAIAMFLAASPIGTLNANVIYNIQYPDFITSILSVFRASGRFIWIVDYMVYTVVFATIANLDWKKTVVFMMSLCLGIQLFDLRDILISKSKSFKEKAVYKSVLDESFEQLVDGAKEFVFLPLPSDFLTHYEMYLTFAVYASEHDMILSSFYIARPDNERLTEYAAKYYDEIEAGGGNPNVVYVFFDKKDVPESNKNLHVVQISDYTVARYIPEN